MLGDEITPCGIELLTVVVGFGVGEQIAACRVATGVAREMDELGFLCMKTVFPRRIVQTIGIPAYEPRRISRRRNC